jgi:glutamyl-tRNA synthetase
MKERATFIEDLLEGSYIFSTPEEFDEKAVQKKWNSDSPVFLREMAKTFEAVQDFSAHNIEEAFKSFVESKGLSMGAILPLFRLVVTGKAMGPSMFETSALIGKEETLRRIESGIKKIQG